MDGRETPGGKRICRRNHIGKYKVQKNDGYARCSVCLNISRRKWRDKNTPKKPPTKKIVYDDTYELGERYWNKVDKTETCWFWSRGKDTFGYGVHPIGSVNYKAHRLAYINAKGAIPKGLVIDHLCRVRHCVNPQHLEVVTIKENIRRSPITIAVINASKTHCIRGHEFTTINTLKSKSTGRACRECKNIVERRRYHKRRKLEKTYV